MCTSHKYTNNIPIYKKNTHLPCTCLIKYISIAQGGSPPKALIPHFLPNVVV